MNNLEDILIKKLSDHKTLRKTIKRLKENKTQNSIENLLLTIETEIQEKVKEL